MSSNHIIQLNTMITRSNEILLAELDGEVIMVGIEQSNYYGLGSVGSRIWELLEQPLTMAELLARLQEEYSIDQETCAKDTLVFLDNLLDHSLISIND